MIFQIKMKYLLTSNCQEIGRKNCVKDLNAHFFYKRNSSAVISNLIIDLSHQNEIFIVIKNIKSFLKRNVKQIFFRNLSSVTKLEQNYLGLLENTQ